jgi:hypothetical protein
MRTASTVQISSIEQLDVPEDTRLRLAIVTLAPIAPQGASGFSPLELVDEIRAAIDPDPQALLEFESRLRATGFVDHEDYKRTLFRFETLRFYKVAGPFPRLIRAHLPRGLTNATYEISIGSCEQHEVDISVDYGD